MPNKVNALPNIERRQRCGCGGSLLWYLVLCESKCPVPHIGGRRRRRTDALHEEISRYQQTLHGP
jgi:hypothetical protein